MQIEQWLPPVLTIAGIIFGGGGIAALYGVYVTRKLGIKTNQNEANRDLNTTWDSIVENLQSQITSQSESFKAELIRLNDEMKAMKQRQIDLEDNLNIKERLVLKAIGHINRQDVVIEKLGGTALPRPEGLE